MKKKLCILTLMVGTTLVLYAQQEPLSSLYNFNMLMVNPAYTGNHDHVISSLIYRSQWSGIEGAPNTINFSIDSPIKTGNKAGLGFQVLNDKIGVMNNTSMVFSYAYHLRLERYNPRNFYRKILSLGLQTNLIEYKADYSAVKTVNPDPTFARSEREMLANFGFGISFKFDRLRISASVPQIFHANDATDIGSLPNGVGLSDSKYLHFFCLVSHSFVLNQSTTFESAVMIKQVRKDLIDVDVNPKLEFNRKIGIGLSYRVGNSVKMLLEVKPIPLFNLGYSYNLSTTDINPHNTGSHELMVQYDLGSIIKIKRFPRYLQVYPKINYSFKNNWKKNRMKTKLRRKMNKLKKRR